MCNQLGVWAIGGGITCWSADLCHGVESNLESGITYFTLPDRVHLKASYINIMSMC